MGDQKGIILYDLLSVMGGAERLTLLLAHALGNVDLCVGYRVAGTVSDKDLEGIKCCFLTSQCDNPGWRTIKLSRVFGSKTGFLSRYEWVLYSGTVAPVAVKNHPEGRNLLYCHTIPRFAYDLENYYMSLLPRWQIPLFKALIVYTRRYYEAAISKMDTIIVNSENVKKRVKKFIGLDSKVVYPPCETDNFRWYGQDGYYLSTARLENFKRVDLIVKSFIRMPDRKLVVTSGGTELKRLKRLANGAPNITFTGWTGEDELRKLMGSAIATIYIPVDEDFGMSPVESMAAGKPVIGVSEGGLLESVIPGETGVLLRPDPVEEDIIDAVQHMDSETALNMRKSCEERAKHFDKAIFIENMKKIVLQ
ncbi:MAG TPA: glycosyltransferase [Desulfobacteraceae bacterium]|nr:glycosyltransferase [Desulfobacteraceae bacterium]HPJ66347.1 glycosyltransferase [Desulfobacteraceae bacterium]HPQ27191.1 glycosyltransferase [Desulfobacteraceae bacterium]